MDLKSGAREAVDRMLVAYGFTSRQQLCAQLKITKSTLANRVFRNSFPADWIIQCCLETGASLLWLSTGQGELGINVAHEAQSIDKLIAPQIELLSLRDGGISNDGYIVMDQSLLADTRSPALVTLENGERYLIEREFEDIKNGTWLIDVEGIICLKKVIRIPVSKVRVSDNDSSFDCDLDEIKFIGKVKLTIMEN